MKTDIYPFRRAPESKLHFEQLLALDPNNANAKAGLEAATLMTDGGDYLDAPLTPTSASSCGEDESNAEQRYASSAAAPRKRIYQIANEKGVGNLANQDDMVMLLSGIEEWVTGALAPLEQRVARSPRDLPRRDKRWCVGFFSSLHALRNVPTRSPRVGQSARARDFLSLK